MLQWGRNFLVTEMKGRGSQVCVIKLELQWGRNFLVTEMKGDGQGAVHGK